MNAAANPFIDGFGEAGTFVWESGTVFDQAGVGYAVYHNSGNGGFELGSVAGNRFEFLAMGIVYN